MGRLSRYVKPKQDRKGRNRPNARRSQQDPSPPDPQNHDNQNQAPSVTPGGMVDPPSTPHVAINTTHTATTQDTARCTPLASEEFLPSRQPSLCVISGVSFTMSPVRKKTRTSRDNEIFMRTPSFSPDSSDNQARLQPSFSPVRKIGRNRNSKFVLERKLKKQAEHSTKLERALTDKTEKLADLRRSSGLIVSELRQEIADAKAVHSKKIKEMQAEKAAVAATKDGIIKTLKADVKTKQKEMQAEKKAVEAAKNGIIEAKAKQKEMKAEKEAVVAAKNGIIEALKTRHREEKEAVVAAKNSIIEALKARHREEIAQLNTSRVKAKEEHEKKYLKAKKANQKTVKKLKENNAKISAYRRDSSELAQKLGDTVNKQQKEIEMKENEIISLNKKQKSLEDTLTETQSTLNKELYRISEERKAVSLDQDRVEKEKLAIRCHIARGVAFQTKHISDEKDRCSDSLMRALDVAQTRLARINYLENSLDAAKKVDAAFGTIRNLMGSNDMKHKFDLFKLANDIVTKEVNGKTNTAKLFWPKANEPAEHHTVRYIKITSGNQKQNSLVKSRQKSVSRKANQMLAFLQAIGGENSTAILKEVVKKTNHVMIDSKSRCLTASQCIAVRDWMRTGNNGMYRLKQAVETFVPELTGLIFPSGIIRVLSTKEREGVIPVRVVEVNVLITRKGNRRGMRPYTYVENPMQLVANLLKKLRLDGEFQKSEDFSFLVGRLVIVVGIDKSDSDLVVTCRICNRVDGNSRLHVIALAILEGPVAECWLNERITIGNPLYPTVEAIQRMMEDSYFCLTFVGRNSNEVFCGVTFFEPDPLPEALTERRYTAEVLPTRLCESKVVFDDKRHEENDDPKQNDEGLPARIRLHPSTRKLGLKLVYRENDSSVVVGYQLVVRGRKVVTNRLYQPMQIGDCPPEKIEVTCDQVSGHVANDGKCINILDGKPGCRCKCPMPCCMVLLENLGMPMEYIQQRMLDEKIASVEWIDQIHPRRCGSRVYDYSRFCAKRLPDKVRTLISELADEKILPDPEKRVGDLALHNTHADYTYQTGEGRLGMTKNEEMRINIDTGSSVMTPIFYVPSIKQNGGIMHGPNGHTTHFLVWIVKSIRARRIRCRWITRLENFRNELLEFRSWLGESMNVGDAERDRDLQANLARTRSTITRTRNNLSEYDDRPDDALMPWDAERRENLRARLEKEIEEEIRLRGERRTHALETDVGYANLINVGMSHLEEAFDDATGKESRLPKEDCEYCFIQLCQRAGGVFDLKGTGMEMTNGNGIKMLQNWSVVSRGMMGLYEADTSMYSWLATETPKWEELARALFEVHVFMKSQRKRDPLECDEKLFSLWCAWKNAFPEVEFNKFHGLFCTARNFIHRFGMAGRVSEESNESFNALLANVKRLLRSMPATMTRQRKVNERLQSNTKEDVGRDKCYLLNERTGKKRGKYGPRKRADDGAKVVSSITDETTVYKEVVFFKLSDGSLLPEKWRDIYEWLAGGVAPKPWREALARTASVAQTEAERAGEGFNLW